MPSPKILNATNSLVHLYPYATFVCSGTMDFQTHSFEAQTMYRSWRILGPGSAKMNKAGEWRSSSQPLALQSLDLRRVHASCVRCGWWWTRGNSSPTWLDTSLAGLCDWPVGNNHSTTSSKSQIARYRVICTVLKIFPIAGWVPWLQSGWL